MSELGKRVLLIDLDPQAGLTTSLGFRDPSAFETTAYEALINEELPLSKAIVETNIPLCDLVPANLNLAAAEAELIGEIGWDKLLRDAIAPVSGEYDFILVDCPPSLGVLTTNALMAAQNLIIPVQGEYLAVMGLEQLNGVISKVRRKGNPDLQMKILRTMYNAQTIHAREVSDHLQNSYSGQVYKTAIKRTIRFADSAKAGRPILSYAPRSEAAEAYRQLAQEVLEGA